MCFVFMLIPLTNTNRKINHRILESIMRWDRCRDTGCDVLRTGYCVDPSCSMELSYVNAVQIPVGSSRGDDVHLGNVATSTCEEDDYQEVVVRMKVT